LNPFDGASAAQDPLLGLFDNGASSSAPNSIGNTAQDALLALLSASGGSSSKTSAGLSATGGLNNADLALALSLYQNQADQQLFSAAAGSGGTSI
jgi:hypothetical protein